MKTVGFNGKRLRQLRNLKGVTQSTVAETLGITTVSYQCYEVGRQKPSIALLPRIAEYFNVSLDYLFGLSDEPYLSPPVAEQT